MAKMPFALQLYSVREVLESDRLTTLRRVKEIGYDHVELAGTPGGTVETFKADLDEAGLGVTACHVEFTACAADLAGVIRDCQTFGVSWAVIPWLCGEKNTSVADWEARACEMAVFGRAFNDAGIRLCYHNHHHEFAELDGGQTAFEVIFDTAAEDALGIELDVGWAQYGGADVVALMKRYAGRIPLLHIKDVKQRYEGEEPVVTELGNGATRFPGVFKAAAEIGVDWLIVEQDESARDSLESARMNAAYMRVHLF